MRDVWIRHDADGSGVVANDEFRRLAPELGLKLTPNALRKAFEYLSCGGMSVSRATSRCVAQEARTL